MKHASILNSLVKLIIMPLKLKEYFCRLFAEYWWSHGERVRRLPHVAFFQVRELYEELTGSGRIKMVVTVVVGK